MHDIFGHEVMEIFDMRYEPTLKKHEAKEGSKTENTESTEDKKEE